MRSGSGLILCAAVCLACIPLGAQQSSVTRHDLTVQPLMELNSNIRIKKVMGEIGTFALGEFNAGFTSNPHHHTYEQINIGLSGVFTIPIAGVPLCPFGATTQTRTQNHGGAWGAPVNVFPSAPPSRLLSSTAYAQKPLTHRIENVGQNLFELIAVLNLTSGDERRTPHEAGFDATPELTNGWYRTYRVTVSPDRPVRHTHAAPVVLVQTSPGIASGTGARIFGLNGPASWAYFDADEGHELRAVGPTATEFVEVEVRQPKVQ